MKFNSATEEAVGLVETAATGIAFRLGRLARDLNVAWARAQRIAYLRQSAPEYPRLGSHGVEDAARRPRPRRFRSVRRAAAATPTRMRGLEAVGLDLNRVHDPADQFELYDETHRERVATDAGKALQAKYGRIAWLHPPE